MLQSAPTPVDDTVTEIYALLSAIFPKLIVLADVLHKTPIFRRNLAKILRSQNVVVFIPDHNSEEKLNNRPTIC